MGARWPSHRPSNIKKTAVFVIFTTELHGAPHSSGGAGPPPLCSGGGGLWFHPIRDLLIHFAIFFLYRGLAVVFFHPSRDFLIYFATFSYLYRGFADFIGSTYSCYDKKKKTKKPKDSANHTALNVKNRGSKITSYRASYSCGLLDLRTAVLRPQPDAHRGAI